MRLNVLAKTTIVASSAILLLILLILNVQSLSSGKNGFERKINASQNIELLYQNITTAPLSRICGITANRVFLNSKDPRIVYSFNYISFTWDTIYLVLPYDTNIQISYELVMDSMGGTLFAGNYSSSFYSPSNAKDSTQVVTTHFETPLFMRCLIISPQSVLLRAFDSTRRHLQFIKADRYTGRTKATIELFDQLNDGGFSTDGMLGYNKKGHNIFYMQYYRNKFYCLDTNLNLIFESRTIDTVNTSPIITRTTKQDSVGSIMSRVPLRASNKMLCVDNGYLYIASNLQANNESDREFNMNTVIDVYSCSTGAYESSFYIPSIEKMKITSFSVNGDKIIACYRKRIAIYKIVSSKIIM